MGFVVLGWSALLALWMRSVMRESTKRKQLIEQLQVAQDSLAAAERQSGILQERQRLAHEIHDTLAQSFTSIVMQLEAAEVALPDEADPARSHVVKARDTARAGLTEARRLVHALRPTQLDGTTLAVALRRVVARWQSESGIKAAYKVTGEPQALHPELEVTLLRAVQEGLENIRKHARAQAVNVTISYMADQVALDILDDGCGFDPEKTLNAPDKTGAGYGLQAMRERIAQFSGEVFIESTPEQGTTIAIQIPMEVYLE
jgi:signal transduction histidine kinase